MRTLSLLIIMLSFISCTKEINTGTHMGMAPIYQDIDIYDQNNIKATAAREFDDLGGIVERGNYIYILERYKGIHVVDNSNPNNPTRILFWEVPGVTLFTLDSTRLYADNGYNLWVIDINDINDLKVIDVEEKVFTNEVFIAPLDYFGYFECPDLEKGLIVGWKRKQLINPECRI